MRRSVTLLVLCILLMTGCAPFILKEQVDAVKQYEYYIFTLKEDVVIEESLEIPKGTDVRLYFVTSTDYIKVYAYPADKTYLKANHSLLLYLFEEDFDNEKFNRARFDKKLFELVTKKERSSVLPGQEQEK